MDSMLEIKQHQQDFEKIINYFKEEIKSVHTGRANPAILEKVKVSAYGSQTPLNQLASISVPEARQLLIEPWDKNIVKDIERSLYEAKLDISIANEGEVIRVTLPLLTQESKQQIIKNLHERAEKSRIILRQLRDKIKEEITNAFKKKDITEDDKYQLFDKLDEETRKYNTQIDELVETKEKEINS